MLSKLLSFFFNDRYMKGRYDGWKACEDMVYARIKKEYPDQADEIWCKLLQ